MTLGLLHTRVELLLVVDQCLFQTNEAVKLPRVEYLGVRWTLVVLLLKCSLE